MCNACESVKKAIIAEDLNALGKFIDKHGTEKVLHQGLDNITKDETLPTLLWHAVHHRKISAVKYLVCKGANVHHARTLDTNTQTPLSYSIILNHSDIFDAMNDVASFDYHTGCAVLEALHLEERDKYVLPLLKKHQGEAQKHRLDSWVYPLEGTALCLAVKKEYLALIEPLIRFGADPHQSGAYASAFQEAVKHFKKGKKEPLTRLLDLMPFDEKCQKALADAIKEKNKDLTLSLLGHCKQYKGGEALLLAYPHDWVDVIDLLLEKGANVDIATGDEQCPTLLFKAVDTGNQPLLSVLLKHKANLNHQRHTDKTETGVNTQTPISCAIRMGNHAFVDQMISDRNYAWNKSTVFAVLEAMHQKRPEYLSILLKDHKVVADYTLDDYKYRGEGTALCIAVDAEFLEAIDLLISHGANPHNIPSGESKSPFARAFDHYKNGKRNPLTRMMKAIFSDGNHVFDSHCQTVLDEAIRDKNKDLTLLLLKYCKHYKGTTGVLLAYKHNWVDVIALLLEKGVGVDVETGEEQLPTLLFKAIDTGNQPLLRVLLNRKANLNYLRTIGGNTQTPISYAVIKGNEAFVDQMISDKNYAWNKSTVFAVLEAMHQGRASCLPNLLKDHKVTEEYTLDDYRYSGKGTALCIAVDSESLDAIELLIHHGSNPHHLPSGESKSAFVRALDLYKQGKKEPLTRMLKAMFSDEKNYPFDAHCKRALDESIRIMDKDLCLFLLSRCKQYKGGTGLLLAYENSWGDVVDLLVEKGAVLDNEKGLAAIMIFNAVETGNQELLTILLKNKANLNILRTIGTHIQTPISLAVIKGNDAFVDQMISDKNYVWNKTTVYAVLEAMHVGRAFYVPNLLKNHKVTTDYSLDDYMIRGKGTALSIAVDAELLDIIELLIHHGSNPHYLPHGESRNAFTRALDLYKQGKKEPLLSMLKAMFSDEENYTFDSYCQTALDEAIKDKHKDLCMLLLERCKQIKGNDGLISAYKNGWLDVISLLLEKGANVDVETGNEQCPTLIFGAIDTGNQDLLSLLLKHKANLNNRWIIGSKIKTPISFAIIKGNQAFVDQMISDENYAWNISTVSAVLEAMHQNRPEYLPSLLKDHEVTSEYSLDDDWYQGKGTALCMAVDADHHEAIVLLLAHGADPHYIPSGITKSAFRRLLDKYKNNKSAYQKYIPMMMQGSIKQDASLVDALWDAVINEDHDVVKILLMLGANPNVYFQEMQRSVLEVAVTDSDDAMVELLITLGQFEFDHRIVTVACYLINKNKSPLAQLLLENHMPEKKYKSDLFVILCTAVKNESVELVNWLLPHCAEQCSQEMPLRAALKNAKIFRLLTQSKSFTWDNGCLEVLLDAIEQDKRDLALELLSKHSAKSKWKIDCRTRWGATAWDLARAAHDTALMKVLEEHGAAQTSNGRIVNLRYSKTYKNTVNSSYVQDSQVTMKAWDKKNASGESTTQEATSTTKLKMFNQDFLYNPKRENCVEFDMVKEIDFGETAGRKFRDL